MQVHNLLDEVFLEVSEKYFPPKAFSIANLNIGFSKTDGDNLVSLIKSIKIGELFARQENHLREIAIAYWYAHETRNFGCLIDWDDVEFINNFVHNEVIENKKNLVRRSLLSHLLLWRYLEGNLSKLKKNSLEYKEFFSMKSLKSILESILPFFSKRC